MSLCFLSQCVTPVLSCDGWHIVTIEGLGSTKEGLHPIQERLAAFHGTQCGFCTPGMVMQMSRLEKKKALFLPIRFLYPSLSPVGFRNCP